MSNEEHVMQCPDCGHDVLRPSQSRCTECGLQWDDWLDEHAMHVRLRARDWLLLFVFLPVVASIPPLLTGRGAITGARTFEASYLLTIPGFVGIVYLAWRYASPFVWRWGRSARSLRGGIVRRPHAAGCIAAFCLLLVMQVLLYLVVIRIGFVAFVEPLRPNPTPLPLVNPPSVKEAA